jgi:hypothetical protein
MPDLLVLLTPFSNGRRLDPLRVELSTGLEVGVAILLEEHVLVQRTAPHPLGRIYGCVEEAR